MKKSASNLFLGLLAWLFVLSAQAQPGNGPGDPFECDCPEDELNPVCVVDDLGNIFSFPSECIALCLGFDLVDGDCGLGDWGDGNGGGDPNPLECDCDDEEFSPVCVIDEMGEIHAFPSECIALCLGFELVDGECGLGDWGDGNGGGDPNPLECDCDEDELNPVCVVDDLGNIFAFPSECIALCLGFDLVDGDCDFGDGNGGGDGNPFDCDCDPNEFAPVCVVDEEGLVHLFPSACLADCLGLEIAGEGDCGDIFEDPNTPQVGEIPQMSISSGMDASDMFGMVNLVNLYPNPASKNFNLNINASNAGLLNVEILNLTGQRVFSSSWQAIDGVQQVEIDIENLESGIYLVRISPSNGNPVTEKFIKK